MRDINTIRTDFDRSVGGSYERNQQVINDIRFAKVPGAQWEGSDNEQYQNKPKPENNKIARQINRILGQYERLEMNAKIISASEKATDEDAELLQSRWRNDFNSSDGIEALNNAADEAFHGGFGAYKLIAKYEDDEVENEDYQNLSIEPVYSAASSIVYNAGAYRKDKRDATQGWHLIRVNRHETEEEFGVSISSYPESTTNYNYFDWYCDNSKDVYIAHYYEVIERRITEYDFGGIKVIQDGRKLTDEYGQKFDRDIFNLLKNDNEYEKETKRIKYVEYALLSGDAFLINPRKTPFKTIPLIPQYGYHQILNGVEYYCGEVARQRDNQRFLNMGFGSMMELMAQPQTTTPEYLPEQVQRFASQFANHTVDNYPYLLTDPVKDAAGNITHVGPVGLHQPAQMGTGLQAAMMFLENNITQQGGTGQSTVPSNASADAIKQVNAREDDSYQPMFQNAMQSLKSACETWIPAAKELYFSNERTIRLEGPDGSYSQIKTMQYDLDEDEEMYGPYKNSCRGMYDVTIKIGESHKSKKEADRAANLEILQFTETNTPMGQVTLNNLILTTTGDDTADARRIARFQNLAIMMQMGIDPQPKTDEERQHVEKLIQEQQQSENNQQPDAAMVMAQAEMLKGQADLLEQQNRQAEMQISAGKIQLDAQSKREKLDSETNLNVAKVNQEQQKINNKAFDDSQKNSIKLTEVEVRAGLELNKQQQSNQSALQ